MADLSPAGGRAAGKYFADLGTSISWSTYWDGNFNREDLSKPENRCNIWFLACLAIPEFKNQVFDLFGLRPGADIGPYTTSHNTPFRPDWTVRLNGEVIAVIESEAGGRNFEAGGDSGLELRRH
jgi:hypothetical protein